MASEYIHISLQLLAAVFAGALIGFERSYHGRPAGFRTHALVCTASSLLMLVTLYQWRWFSPGALERISVDPTRMAQGIMTGIGFLGAGVIFKTGVNIQGLTTAASVWATAAIGLLFGVGAYVPGVMAAGAVLATLVVLRWVELVMPANVYVFSTFRFDAGRAPSGEAFRALLASEGASLSELSYAKTEAGAFLEFSGVLRMPRIAVLHALAERLRTVDGLVEYQLDRISK